MLGHRTNLAHPCRLDSLLKEPARTRPSGCLAPARAPCIGAQLNNYVTPLRDHAYGDPVAKKHSKSAQVDRQAISLSASVVADMKHIWREITVSDVGIDAQIEIVDPASDHAAARFLFVQSKGRTGPFDRENDTSFTFRCRQEDIDYWLSTPVPVLLGLLALDEAAWFKDLHAWFTDPQRRRSRVVEFDKQADAFDVSAGQRLLDVAVPASSGLYFQPPPKHETLTTNLLQIEQHGAWIYAAPSNVKGWTDINARLSRGA